MIKTLEARLRADYFSEDEVECVLAEVERLLTDAAAECHARGDEAGRMAANGFDFLRVGCLREDDDLGEPDPDAEQTPLVFTEPAG